MQAVFEGDDHTLLVSSQNGSRRASTWINGAPDHRHGAGARTCAAAYRWYWTAPLIVSSFNPNTIYTGANLLFAPTIAA